MRELEDGLGRVQLRLKSRELAVYGVIARVEAGSARGSLSARSASTLYGQLEVEALERTHHSLVFDTRTHCDAS